MHTELTNHPVEQVIAAIQALDLEPVKLRVMDPKLGEGWSREYAESIEQAYKNYLTMLVKYQDDAEDILLAEDVDEFWHTHILQTIKYTEDCEAIFGKYLHHTPHIGEVTQADMEKRAALAQKTRRLYQQEFGDGQNYEVAWSGNVVEVQDAAYSGATIRAERAAYSGATIRPENAAYSGATIKAENAAYSGASIRAENAAYFGATVRTGSGPHVRFLAMSGAA